MAQPGDPIILDLALWDRSSNMHILARLKADGIPMPISPVVVPHLNSGRYFYMNPGVLKFPENIFEVDVDYEVYKDSSYTQVSPIHAPAKDTLRLDPTVAPSPLPPDITKELNEIKQLILAQGLGSDLIADLITESDLNAILVEDVVNAEIVFENELIAVLDSDEVIAIVADSDDELIAVLQEG